MDEYHRMRSSDVAYITNTYPLVDRRITRADCVAWLTAQRLDIPPKSACTFCPYHSLGAWQQLKNAGGSDWAEAVKVDATIRHKRPLAPIYVHPARQPLEQAADDNGQLALDLEIPCDGGVCFT